MPAMPRATADHSLDALVRAAVDDVVARASRDLARAIAELTAEQLESRLEAEVGGAMPRSRRRPPADLSKWAADRRARRVPNFVIEATGLDTKKKIVAKYGENAVFEKGKPLPKVRA